MYHSLVRIVSKDLEAQLTVLHRAEQHVPDDLEAVHARVGGSKSTRSPSSSEALMYKARDEGNTRDSIEKARNGTPHEDQDGQVDCDHVASTVAIKIDEPMRHRIQKIDVVANHRLSLLQRKHTQTHILP